MHIVTEYFFFFFQCSFWKKKSQRQTKNNFVQRDFVLFLTVWLKVKFLYKTKWNKLSNNGILVLNTTFGCSIWKMILRRFFVSSLSFKTHSLLNSLQVEMNQWETISPFSSRKASEHSCTCIDSILNVLLLHRRKKSTPWKLKERKTKIK